MRHHNIRPSTLEACFLSINLISSSVIMVAVGILTSYHVYCITTNTTTIEGWEKGRSLTIKGMGKIQNVKCPYDQGIYKNLQSVLGQWPIFWFLPGPMSGTGLDFPISTKYMSDGLDDEEKEGSLEKSQQFSSTTSLNRSGSLESHWTSYTTELARSHTVDSRYGLTVDITPLQPLKTKPSNNTINSRRSAPATPGSILTFASTATTLVDFHHNSHKLPSKLPNSYSDSDYSMTFR
ncbi:hypothetical protein INT47_013260 [Mucor saturninus]|uniref:Palmitoyltransferase n=1 Tax=Mucor saturninus TaxID=64648 RepID=A0A8H7R225_9FUNG|nr:hypothetical protein INT47_013260 [Mucor saturninus]